MITWYTESLIFISFFLLRLVKAIENLQHFSLSADPSFRHYQMDVSRELKALSSMDFIQGFYKNVLFYVKYNNKMHMHLNLHLISPLMFLLQPHWLLLLTLKRPWPMTSCICAGASHRTPPPPGTTQWSIRGKWVGLEHYGAESCLKEAQEVMAHTVHGSVWMMWAGPVQ